MPISKVVGVGQGIIGLFKYGGVLAGLASVQDVTCDGWERGRG
jgi:hypothetical protein